MPFERLAQCPRGAARLEYVSLFCMLLVIGYIGYDVLFQSKQRTVAQNGRPIEASRADAMNRPKPLRRPKAVALEEPRASKSAMEQDSAPAAGGE